MINCKNKENKTKWPPPSQHDVDTTTLHQHGASCCRPARRRWISCVAPHIVFRAVDCWSPPNVHPAPPPLQGRPRQERPPDSPQGPWQGSSDVHGTFPETSYTHRITVLQQLLLLHPVLPVAVLQGKFNDEGGKFTEFSKTKSVKNTM